MCNKSIVQICVNNVKPIVETRKIRKFRLTYKVPFVAGLSRQQGKAIYWLTRSLLSNNVSKNVNINQFYCLARTVNSNLKKKFDNNFIDQKSTKHRFYKNFKNDKDQNIRSRTPRVDALLIYLTKFYNFIEKNECKMIECLSQQFLSGFSSKVEIIDKRKQLHQDALKNRAYANYRWW